MSAASYNLQRPVPPGYSASVSAPPTGGPNRYSVNPPPKGGSWVERNGKSVLVGGLVVGGLILGGALVYVVASGLLQSLNPSTGSPACQALMNQVAQTKAQIGLIYAAAAKQGGTFTAGQTSSLQQLYATEQNLITQMSNQSVCPVAPGTQLATTINTILLYAGWLAIGIMATFGILFTALGVQRLIARWGGSSTDKGTPPKSLQDLDTSGASGSEATFGADVASSELASEVEEGSVTALDASTAASALQAADPAVASASSISADYSTAAALQSDAEAVTFLDQLSLLWFDIVSALSDAWLSFIVFIGL